MGKSVFGVSGVRSRRVVMRRCLHSGGRVAEEKR
jgi:hypothetical protein